VAIYSLTLESLSRVARGFEMDDRSCDCRKEKDISCNEEGGHV